MAESNSGCYTNVKSFNDFYLVRSKTDSLLPTGDNSKVSLADESVALGWSANTTLPPLNTVPIRLVNYKLVGETANTQYQSYLVLNHI